MLYYASVPVSFIGLPSIKQNKHAIDNPYSLLCLKLGRQQLLAVACRRRHNLGRLEATESEMFTVLRVDEKVTMQISRTSVA